MAIGRWRAYVAWRAVGAVTELGEEVEGQGVAVHQEAPAALFLKRLHVRLNSREVESLRRKKVELRRKTGGSWLRLGFFGREERRPR